LNSPATHDDLVDEVGAELVDEVCPVVAAVGIFDTFLKISKEDACCEQVD